MADPVVTDIAQGEWVIVATAITCGMLDQIARGFDYYQTYRDTGGSAPATIVATDVPEEAVPMFQQNSQEIIASSVAIDVYVCCWNKDNKIEVKDRAQALMNYLVITSLKLQNKDFKKPHKKLNKLMKSGVIIDRWSYDSYLAWLEKSNYNEAKKSFLVELTNEMKSHNKPG